MVKSELNEVLLPYPIRGSKKIWVYIPEHNENEKLPVIYMTDGQNLFSENATPFGSWGVIGAIENEMKNTGAGAAVVGIDNGSVYRDSELTPESIGEVQHRDLLNDIFTPEGEIFDAFLMNTVIPYVEEHYPVKTDSQSRSVCGSSSGGLQAFFEGVEHGDKFAFVGALSPAFLLYTENDWRNYLAPKMCGASLPYLYIYTGCSGEEEKMIFDSVEMMYDLLIELGYPLESLNEVVLLENEHNERAWKEIFKDFLHTVLHR